MKDTFYAYHPTINLLYFIFVLGFSMIFVHPVCLGLSLVGSFAYSFYLNGKRTIRFGFAFMLPMLIVTALLSPAFNHQGGTILAYLPDGNPLTLESIIYGIVAAVRLITVVNWFSCFNVVMTSDKFVYLFGRIIPALSLILAMVLRFVPRFKAQLTVISNAQKCVGRDVSDGSLFTRAQRGIRILSIMVTWTLENAIETADSMKSRGYGLPGRTAFSIYRFDRRDRYAFLYLMLCGVYVVLGAAAGSLDFRYYPTVKGGDTGLYTISLFAAYSVLCAMPLLINIKEDRKWKSLRSKI